MTLKQGNSCTTYNSKHSTASQDNASLSELMAATWDNYNDLFGMILNRAARNQPKLHCARPKSLAIIKDRMHTILLGTRIILHAQLT